ncbi:MAG: MFS transporter [Thermoplasmataceae archaeon]
MIGKIGSQSKVIKALALSDFIRGLGRYPLWIILVIYLSSTRGLSYIEIGFLFFLQSAIAFPFNIIGGKVIDRIGRRSGSLILPFGLILLYFLLFYSVYFNQDISIIILEMFAVGVLNSIQWVVINAIVTDNSSSSERLNAFSALRVLGNAGIGVGLVLAGIFSTFQPAYFFLIPSIGSLLEFIIFIKYIPESISKEGSNRSQKEVSFKASGDLLLIAVAFLMAVSMLFANQWETPTLPLYLTTYVKIPEFYITLLYAINTLVVIFFQYHLNVVAEKIGFVKSFSIGLLMYSISFIVFGLTGNLILLAFNVVLLTIGESLTNPFLSVTISKIAPEGKRGEYFGYNSAISGIFGTLSPFIGTLFLTFLFRPPLEMWLAFSLITLLMAILSLLVRDRILHREKMLLSNT